MIDDIVKPKWPASKRLAAALFNLAGPNGAGPMGVELLQDLTMTRLAEAAENHRLQGDPGELAAERREATLAAYATAHPGTNPLFPFLAGLPPPPLVARVEAQVFGPLLRPLWDAAEAAVVDGGAGALRSASGGQLTPQRLLAAIGLHRRRMEAWLAWLPDTRPLSPAMLPDIERSRLAMVECAELISASLRVPPGDRGATPRGRTPRIKLAGNEKIKAEGAIAAMLDVVTREGCRDVRDQVARRTGLSTGTVSRSEAWRKWSALRKKARAASRARPGYDLSKVASVGERAAS